MQPEDFQRDFAISNDVLNRFRVYEALLRKWQTSINLVSQATLEDVWVRHFADSAQLVQYFLDPRGPGFRRDDKFVLADLGSGAGFPGMVIAIMRPDLEVHLVESDERKIQFLKTVSRETNTEIVSHNARIESVVEKIRPDFVTARALAPLKNLLDYCFPWAEQNPNLHMMFLKGRRFAEEIDEARAFYDFDADIVQSQTDPEGRIILIRDVVFR